MDQVYAAGTSNIMLEVMMRNSTTGEGVTGITPSSMIIYYIAEGGAADVSVAPVTGVLGTYSSGAWVQVDAANMPGLYQFGIPNAALATGPNSVTFIFQSAGSLNKYLRIILTQADLRNSTSLGVSDISASFSNTQVLASVMSSVSGWVQRTLSLVGDNQGVPSGSVTLDANGNPLTYYICGYDTAAHALTNDGVTGVINKVQVTNTYNASGWSSSTIERIT